MSAQTNQADLYRSDGTLRLKPYLFCIVALLLGVMSSACEPDPVATSITLSKTSATLTMGESVTLTAEVLPTDAIDKVVKWSSSNAGVASVSNGKVTAISIGTATITAQAGSVKAQCTITVKPIEVSSVTLNKSTLTLYAGDTFTLTATITPTNATDQTIVWSSSNTSVAKVVNGLVTAVAVGTTTITAKVGDVKAECSVTVSPIEVTSVTLSQTSVNLLLGESATLTATVLPEDATDKTVTWTSSNSAVAVVTNGKIDAVGVGTATITAQAGSIMAECVVNVSPIEVISVTLSQTSVNLLLGESATLTATVLPEDATDKTVTWTSSNSAVAVVTNGKIDAVGVGTATIIAQAGGIKAECVVNVSPIEVTQITLNITSKALSVGETVDLVATISPEDATYKTVTWTSSDTSVATVTNGKVTAVALGSATITATAHNGVSSTCSISVVSKPPYGGSEGTGEEEW